MKGPGQPPATSYHRFPVRVFNFIARRLWRLGLLKADLREHSLLEAARRATGLHHFGDESFRIPMRRLLWSLEHESELNPLGRYLTRQVILRILRHRLLATELFDRHPEILARELLPPVVIVGLGRTGTTKLHRLLACDRRFSSLPAWEAVNPIPWPESFGPGEDPRIANIRQGLKVVQYLGPQIMQVHPLSVDEPEEEVGLLEHAFASQLFEIQHYMPTFAEWLMDSDQSHAYRYLRDLLRLVEWFRGEPPRPWILKSPQHMQDLDCLLEVMPGAKVLFTHRDPPQVIGSLCSMAWNSMVRDTDQVDPHWIGREWSSKAERMVRKIMRLREGIPAAQQLDLMYADIMADPFAQIGRIYDFIGLELDRQTRQAMEDWLERNQQHAHGHHHYELADFGLDREELEERFRFYRDHYAIPGQQP